MMACAHDRSRVMAWCVAVATALMLGCATAMAQPAPPPPAAAAPAPTAPSVAPAGHAPTPSVPAAPANLSARAAGPFDIAFWSDLAEALPAEGQRLAGVVS